MADYKLTPEQAVAVGRVEPAFPSSPDLTSGITTRDYLAAQVLGAVYTKGYPSWSEAAEEAYRMADAMLKARAK